MQRRGSSGQSVKGQRQGTKSEAGKVPTARASIADRDELLEQRTRERDEVLQQQEATSEVLSIIRRSPADAQPVFDAIVQSAARLCGAIFGGFHLYENDRIRMVATNNFTPKATSQLHEIQQLKRPERSNLAGRAVLDRALIHVPDVFKDPEYSRELALAGGWRAVLALPLLCEGKPVGALAIAKAEPTPFSDRQIQLLKTFADQAVIAIENVRLFETEQARTRELSEALEQQTATSEVLRVISSSPTNVQPVFDAIAESAVRLCDGQFSFVLRFDGKLMDFASCCGLSAEGLDTFRRMLPLPLSGDTASGRAIVRRAVVEIPDVQADPAYGPQAQGLAKAVTYRSIAAIPLLHEGNPIGTIAVARANAGSFPTRQIVLLQAFADQAVIAIQNVRLFDEVQARTRELAKSLDDLRTTQDRLVQTQKLALLGQLTAGIAHEIKNPLNFVNNFSGISAEMIDELRDALEARSPN
jgi:two-component system, NtrC family, sensor kinase